MLHNFYFYKNPSFETPYQLYTCPYQRPSLIRCMACFSINLAHLHCLYSLVMAGGKSQQPEEILWPHLHHYVHLECGHHLVDMECVSTGRCQCLSGQQPADVFSLARI